MWPLNILWTHITPKEVEKNVAILSKTCLAHNERDVWWPHQTKTIYIKKFPFSLIGRHCHNWNIYWVISFPDWHPLFCNNKTWKKFWNRMRIRISAGLQTKKKEDMLNPLHIANWHGHNVLSDVLCPKHAGAHSCLEEEPSNLCSTQSQGKIWWQFSAAQDQWCLSFSLSHLPSLSQ